MGKKRPERTAHRASARLARKRVHDRERLAALSPGGAAERPLEVPTSSVIEGRARGTPCPQCEGTLAIEDHQAPSAQLRAVAVRCQRCGVARTLYFRIVSHAPS